MESSVTTKYANYAFVIAMPTVYKPFEELEKADRIRWLIFGEYLVITDVSSYINHVIIVQQSPYVPCSYKLN